MIPSRALGFPIPFRRLRVLAVLAFLAAVMPSASPQEGEGSGLQWRGAGAQIAGRIARAEADLAAGRVREARAVSEDQVHALTRRRGDPDGSLEVEVIDSVVGRFLSIRNAAIRTEAPDSADWRGDFVVAVSDAATFTDWRYGVPASITLAQAILESDWGRSAPGFNLFGMKGEGPEGSTVRRVVEYRGGKRRHKMAPFRAYEDFAGSIADHGSLLGKSSRYEAARAVSEDTPAFARALQGRYATDPRYARKLVDLIRVRRLDRYDWSATGPWG